MKLLKDNQFEELTARANAFLAIVSAMVESGEDIKAEEITSDVVIQALQQAAENGVAGSDDLQQDLDTANARITELEGEITTANSRIAELEKELDETPGSAPATITSKGEPNAEKQDILDFAKKNAGDPFAVLAEAEKQGYL